MNKLGQEVSKEKVEEARRSLEGSRAYFEWYRGFSRNQYDLVFSKSKNSFEDYRESKPGATEGKMQFWLRSLVRTIFFHIEGICYCMRQISLWSIERGELQLSPGLFAVLSEKRYSWRNSRITESHEYLDMKGSIEISFHYYARLYSTEFNVDFSGLGWDSLVALETIRNKLTHPQIFPEDYRVVPDVVIMANNAAVWFDGLIVKLDLTCDFIYHDAAGAKDRELHHRLIERFDSSYTTVASLEKDSRAMSNEGVGQYPDVGLLETPMYLRTVHEGLRGDTIEAWKELDEKLLAMKTLLTNPSYSIEDDDEGRQFHLSCEINTYFRILIKALCSEIDGVCQALRHVILSAYADNRIDLSAGEIALLREERFYYQKRSVRTVKNYNRPIVNFELSFNLLFRLLGSHRTIDRSDDTWRTLRTTLELRNEVTHPKNLTPFHMELLRVDDVKKAHLWFINCISSLMNDYEQWLADSAETKS